MTGWNMPPGVSEWDIPGNDDCGVPDCISCDAPVSVTQVDGLTRLHCEECGVNAACIDCGRVHLAWPEDEPAVCGECYLERHPEDPEPRYDNDREFWEDRYDE